MLGLLGKWGGGLWVVLKMVEGNFILVGARVPMGGTEEGGGN